MKKEEGGAEGLSLVSLPRHAPSRFRLVFLGWGSETENRAAICLATTGRADYLTFLPLFLFSIYHYFILGTPFPSDYSLHSITAYTATPQQLPAEKPSLLPAYLPLSSSDDQRGAA